MFPFSLTSSPLLIMALFSPFLIPTSLVTLFLLPFSFLCLSILNLFRNQGFLSAFMYTERERGMHDSNQRECEPLKDLEWLECEALIQEMVGEYTVYLLRVCFPVLCIYFGIVLWVLIFPELSLHPLMHGYIKIKLWMFVFPCVQFMHINNMWTETAYYFIRFSTYQTEQSKTEAPGKQHSCNFPLTNSFIHSSNKEVLLSPASVAEVLKMSLAPQKFPKPVIVKFE